MSTQFVIGQKAVIMQGSYGARTAQIVTVERDTKLYWVAGGRKFRKTDGVEPASNHWTWSSFLLPADEPRAVEALEQTRRRDAFNKVANGYEALTRNRESPEHVEALKQALTNYSRVLEPSN